MDAGRNMRRMVLTLLSLRVCCSQFLASALSPRSRGVHRAHLVCSLQTKPTSPRTHLPRQNSRRKRKHNLLQHDFHAACISIIIDRTAVVGRERRKGEARDCVTSSSTEMGRIIRNMVLGAAVWSSVVSESHAVRRRTCQVCSSRHRSSSPLNTLQIPLGCTHFNRRCNTY